MALHEKYPSVLPDFNKT